MVNALTGRNINLYKKLKEEIDSAQEIKIIVSFLRESGVKLIVDDLKKQALKGADIKIITSKYLGITEPSALYLLKKELGNLIDLRFYNKEDIAFHPKAYFIKKKNDKILFIGSSNISASALTSGIEWNYELFNKNDQKAYQEFENEFDRIYQKETTIIDNEELRKYTKSWKNPQTLNVVPDKTVKQKDEPEPRGAQIEALYELDLARKEGINKGMVVGATGIGKTYIAGFDSLEFDKILFLAHREEILKQANKTFNKIKPNIETGFFKGEIKEHTQDIIFASVQTLRKKKYLNKYFQPDSFDYIIVDEFHHAAADSYINVIEYFKPEFLLGLTATPYRMDNKDIYEICNDNVIYEINMKDAINRDLLVPFKYYGIYDDQVDYNEIDYTNGKYNTKDLEKKLSTHKRTDLILKHYKSLAGDKCLGFCASIKHAKYMAEKFNENNIKAVCVHSASKKEKYSMERDQAIKKLENGNIDVIFAVDIFNEGVDVPSLNTVLFLRPTESYVVFLQQLGRGLRKNDDKDYLKVLDFIGNYKRAHYIPYLLSGENPMEQKNKDYSNLEEFDFPDNCYINFDLQAIDLFKEMAESDPLIKRMEDEYFRLKNYLGRKPLRKDIYDGVDIDIREYLKGKYTDKKGYLRFLDSIDELNSIEQDWLNTIIEEFLIELENTRMSKAYKIPVLLSLIDDNKLKMAVDIEQVGETYMNFYKNSKLHQKDFNNKKHENWESWGKDKYVKEVLKNPVNFLSKRKFFIHDEINNKFRLHQEIEPFISEELTKHYIDILKYRENRYFERRFK